jgi:hypothetical protein
MTDEADDGRGLVADGGRELVAAQPAALRTRPEMMVMRAGGRSAGRSNSPSWKASQRAR